MITQEELQAIRERADRATPGPWVLQDAMNVMALNTLRNVTACNYTYSGDRTGSLNQNIANAQFIAGARQDIPALLVEVERLQGEVAKLEYDIAVMRGEINDFEGEE